MKNNMRTLLLLLAALATGFLQGCGGGGGGGDSNVSATAAASPGGIYGGTVFAPATNTTAEVLGIITEDGHMFFLADNGLLAVGTVGVTNTNTLTGNYSVYAPDYIGFSANGNQIYVEGHIDAGGVGTISGTIAQRSSMTGNMFRVGMSSSFSLSYEAVIGVDYDRNSSLATVAGNYMYVDGGTGGVINVSIDSNGAITGGSSYGCSYSGSVSLIDLNYNAYRTAMTVSSCGINNGTYYGVGILSDTTITNDTLTVAIANSNYAYAIDLIRF